MLQKMIMGSSGGDGKSYSILLSAFPSNGRVECGFRPKKILIDGPNYTVGGTVYHCSVIYDYDQDPTHFKQGWNNQSPLLEYEIDNTTRQITSIDNTGFVMGYSSNYGSTGSLIVLG